MFTGIVEETGQVVDLESLADIVTLRIRAQRVVDGLVPGSSIAVDGCCLTAIACEGQVFKVELTPETLRRTAFGRRLRAGARVNLERPLRADGRFDGHIVQGHVDGVGEVLELRRLGASAELHIAAPAEGARYLVTKGSVAVAGVSLTVAQLDGAKFVIALIPFTLEATTLGELGPGDVVNLEYDVIAKYVERLVAPHVAG